MTCYLSCNNISAKMMELLIENGDCIASPHVFVIQLDAGRKSDINHRLDVTCEKLKGFQQHTIQGLEELSEQLKLPW